MTTANPMTQLYKRLSSEVGISRNFVREKILPEWWDDRAAINPAGYAEAIGYISRSLSLDLQSLLPDRQIQWASHRISKFKHAAKVSEDQLAVAQAIATRVAELAVHMTAEPYKVIPQSAQAIRNDILANGATWVALDNLLDYCWSHGIPVVPVTQFPNHTRKMDGLATCADGRPAIVISKVSKHSSWLLFVLAHELGHIALGHLNKHAVVVDTKVEPDSKDSDEEAANRFANELLAGDPVIRYTAAKYLRADELAAAAQKRGQEDRVYPGVIALNYAWHREFFAVGNAALKLIEPNTQPLHVMHARLLKNINIERLPDESGEYLLRMVQPE